MFPLFKRFRHVNFYLFEAFLMFRFVSQSISMIAINLLIQDKICLLQYDQEAKYCQNIQLESDTANEKNIQNLILTEATTFNLYKNFLECIPMFIWSLFVGSFLDRFPSGTTFLLFSNVLGSIAIYMIYIINVNLDHSTHYYLLIGSLPILFTGGMTTLLVVVFRYITVNTAENERSYKFVVLEIIFVLGFSGASYLGGQLLQLYDIDPKHPEQFVIRTYKRNFIISIAFDLLSIFFLYLLRKTEKSRLEEKLQLEKIIQEEIQALIESGEYEENDDEIVNLCPKSALKVNRTSASTSAFNAEVNYGAVNTMNLNSALNDEETIEELINKGKMRNLFKILFDIDNLQQTLACFGKRRPNRIRLQIFMLYFVLFLQLLTTQGMTAVFLQFAEKVYQWDSERYSTLNALSQVISMALLAFGTGIFIKWLKWVDETLIILSLISTFLRLMLMGTYLSEKAFFASLFVGFLSGFTVVTIRTKISKIVPEEEIGKIFSLSSSMESLVPLGGSLIFSNLFSITINSYPGFVYHFAAILILISLAITVFEEVYCPIKSYHDLLDGNRFRRRYSSLPSQVPAQLSSPARDSRPSVASAASDKSPTGASSLVVTAAVTVDGDTDIRSQQSNDPSTNLSPAKYESNASPTRMSPGMNNNVEDVNKDDDHRDDDGDTVQRDNAEQDSDSNIK